MPKRLHFYRENLIYLSLWLILFVTPILSLYLRSFNNPFITFEWSEVFFTWKSYAVFFIIFAIHNFILAPLLIYKDKKITYLVATFFVLIAFIAFQCTQHPRRHFDKRMEMMDRHMNAPIAPSPGKDFNMPPDFNGNGMRDDRKGPKHDEFRDQRNMNKKANFDKNAPFFFFGGKNIIDTVIMLFLFGMNLGVKSYFKTEKKEEEMKELEKRNLSTQLEYLKYQINPHFFMNTLNNIHALVDIDPEKAKTTIVELSKMMRYLLYEGNKQLVPVQREHQFVESYIALMKLRYTDKVEIVDDVPEQIPNMMIPPLLTINFIENAFKHGISYQRKSFIHIELRITGNRMFFACRNSKNEESTKDSGGIGISNTRKRLDLLFGEDYSLEINDNGDVYEVKMDIPLTSPSTNENSEKKEL